MAKGKMEFNLSVTILREGKRFVAYSPGLDLSTSGKTLVEASRRFTEAAMIFFEELTKKGTLEEALLDLGWQKKNKVLEPPLVASQKAEKIMVAA